jgi:hypothetical protein
MDSLLLFQRQTTRYHFTLTIVLACIALAVGDTIWAQEMPPPKPKASHSATQAPPSTGNTTTTKSAHQQHAAEQKPSAGKPNPAQDCARQRSTAEEQCAASFGHILWDQGVFHYCLEKYGTGHISGNWWGDSYSCRDEDAGRDLELGNLDRFCKSACGDTFATIECCGADSAGHNACHTECRQVHGSRH